MKKFKYILFLLVVTLTQAQQKGQEIFLFKPTSGFWEIGYVVVSNWNGNFETEEIQIYIQNFVDRDFLFEIKGNVQLTCGRIVPIQYVSDNSGPTMMVEGHQKKYTWSTGLVTPFSKKETCIFKKGNINTAIMAIDLQLPPKVRDLTAEKHEKEAAEAKKKQEEEARIAAEKEKKANEEKERLAKEAKAKEERLAKEAKEQKEKEAVAAKVKEKQKSNDSASGNTDIVNGVDRNTLPKLAKGQDGKYYAKDANNNYHEISYDTYMAGKKAEQVNSKPVVSAEDTKRANDRIIADTNKMLKDKDADFWADKKASDQKIEQKSELWAQSYYAATALQDAKSNFSNAKHLKGNYASLQELQDEFDEKYSTINSQAYALENARNEDLKAGVRATFDQNNADEKLVGDAVELVGGFVNSLQADKDKKDAREALEKKKAEEEAKFEAKRWAAVLQLRNGFINQFPDGGIPLSSHKVSGDEVFLFSYVFDKTKIEQPNPPMVISNVFPIARYNDGTWPFKNAVQSDLKKLAPGNIVMVGYYASKEVAEATQQAFVDMAAKTGFTVKNINYTGKKSSGGAAGDDFWGTGNEGTKPVKKATEGEDDFWETGKKKEAVKPKPAPEKKPTEEKKPAKNNDFWD